MFIISPLNSQINRDTFICYGKFPVAKVKGYKYVIVESAHFSKEDVATLKHNNTHILAYISLGEVNTYAKHFNTLKPFLLEKNTIWNSYTLDISNETTHDTLLNVIDKTMQEGYHGLFLDNIDNYTEHGNTYHLKENLICLLKQLKTYYPSIFLVQNAGLSLVKDTKGIVNAIAIESVASDYQFSTKTYQLRAYHDFLKRITHVKQQHKHSALPFIFIEYADNKKLNKLIIRRLKKKIASKNNSIFVNEINLQTPPKNALF